MFLVHRLPFLWRLQARLGVREVLGDAIVQFTEGPKAPIAMARSRVQHLARQAIGYAGVLAGAGVLAWWVRSLVRR
jgi:hypothetical protein